MAKIKRFGQALRYESAKRLPYIAVIFAIILLVGAVQSYNRTAESAKAAKDNSAQTKMLVTQNKTLTQQVKDLGEQNKALQEDTRRQSFCFVKAFAIYTQTGQPVTLEEIQACDIKAIQATSQDSAATPAGAGTPSSPQSSSSSSSPQSAPTPAPSQSNNQQPTGIKKVCSKIPLVKKVCN